jgi:hypothetical protein
MAISTKYGRVEIPKISDDEPVFILRAQDKLAAPIIEMYRTLAASHGSTLTDSLNREIEAFKRWQGAKKLPD